MYLPAALKGPLFIVTGLAFAAWGVAATSEPTTRPATTTAAARAATHPSTHPSTHRAGVLDQSTPKALLRTFYASRGEVNEATIRSLLHASNPVEQKVLDSVVQVELADTRLRAAERAKFGHATSAPSFRSPLRLSELDSFSEKIEGDHATVSAPDAPNTTMEFIRVDGKWKLPISSLVGKLDPTIAHTLGVATAAQIQIIDGVTADLRAGKFTSQDEVHAELTRRFEARLAATRAATQPATQPTTRPATQPAK